MQTTRVYYRRQFRNEILNFFMRNCSFRRVRFGRILYIHGRCQSSAPHCHCCLCWMHWKTPSPRERQAMRMSLSSWLRAPLTRQPTIDSVVVVGWLGLWRLVFTRCEIGLGLHTCWSIVRTNISSLYTCWLKDVTRVAYRLRYIGALGLIASDSLEISALVRIRFVVIMSKDLKGKRASLWHAYTALQEQGKDKESAVAKGQLKVCNVHCS